MSITEWEVRRGEIEKRNIKILLCDDDVTFLDKLGKEIECIFLKLNMVVTIYAYNSPADIKMELYNVCDMAFLDIDFEGKESNGIDIARKLRMENRHVIIFFVTNYIEYAPVGYEVQAFRYILKGDREEVLERYILQARECMAEGREYLQLRDKELIVDVPLEQITYLEVLDHYVSIYAGDNEYTFVATLSSLEKELDKYGFLRIHKSYLVNMQSIRKFRSRECLLNDGTALAVSEKNYSQQKQKYLLWKGMK